MFEIFLSYKIQACFYMIRSIFQSVKYHFCKISMNVRYNGAYIHNVKSTPDNSTRSCLRHKIGRVR